MKITKNSLVICTFLFALIAVDILTLAIFPLPGEREVLKKILGQSMMAPKRIALTTILPGDWDSVCVLTTYQEPARSANPQIRAADVVTKHRFGAASETNWWLVTYTKTIPVSAYRFHQMDVHEGINPSNAGDLLAAQWRRTGDDGSTFELAECAARQDALLLAVSPNQKFVSFYFGKARKN